MTTNTDATPVPPTLESWEVDRLREHGDPFWKRVAATIDIQDAEIAAHLAEVERLKANQRTHGTYEVCNVCSSHLDKVSASAAHGKYTIRCGEDRCPIRTPSGAK